MVSYGFHPDALIEYREATDYYVREASPAVAERFVATVESGIATLLAAPDRWRVVDTPGIRRYVVRRFPYLLYYRWDREQERVTVFAVMHSNREPGYWKGRIG